MIQVLQFCLSMNKPLNVSECFNFIVLYEHDQWLQTNSKLLFVCQTIEANAVQ